jgi:hypothetical protein
MIYISLSHLVLFLWLKSNVGRKKNMALACAYDLITDMGYKLYPDEEGA